MKFARDNNICFIIQNTGYIIPGKYLKYLTLAVYSTRY